MPQTYLHGGDSDQAIKDLKYAGQTFHPDTDFTLEWIDLQLNLPAFLPEPVVQLFFAGADHKPWGDVLSRNISMDFPYYTTIGTKRVRFRMGKILLTTDTYYCIQVIYPLTLLAGDLKWQYDAGDATYPRGIRISSDDGGATWSTHFNDDHLFAVFGTPPAPPPPPEPPIHNWAILTIGQIITATGYIIIPVTNVPCHLYMYWTTHEPQKHLRTIIERGLTVPTASQYCFVDWHENEQAEPGDTIVHTFTKEPWASCETRWFVFRAKIDNEWSPSISPIFKKHRLYVPPSTVTKYFYPHIWPEVDSCDGRARRLTGRDMTWADVHDGAGTWAQSSAEVTYADIAARRNWLKWNNINRSFLLFNTDEIPAGSNITEAKLSIWIVGTFNDLNPLASINLFQSWPISTAAIVAADYQNLAAVPLSSPWAIPHLTENYWIEFILNASGRNLVIPAGCTKLAIREATYDAPNREPPWLRLKRAFAQWESADVQDHIPCLEVTYEPP